jgi:glycosyltransferase involved in cell wall biosynthesis
MGVPAVSVIIPCFNLGLFLDEAVASVEVQTFTDFELVIVDDGSTDALTLERLEAHRARHVRVIRTENHGLPAAKNVGFANTSGRYVCAVDADDRLEPQMLERSVAILEKNPEIAFVSHWLRYFGDASGDWKPERCDFPALLDMNTVNGAALVRRSAYDAAGGYDDAFRSGCEDWDFWITLVERGWSGHIIPEVLYNYRRRPDSMSRIMLRDEGHPALYERLVAKHAAAYASHLAALILRRERGIVDLRRHCYDLILEYNVELQPALAKLRDDVAALEATVEQSQRAAATRGLEDQLAAAAERVRALEASISWRATAPLRAVYDGVLRLRALFR